MEAIGLTIGIASLFSTCIECFDLFQAAKDYDEYVEILLVKLDLEKTRLLIWGNGVGIMKSHGDGRAPELDDEAKAPTIQKCLERIKSLLSTFDTFQAKYGLRQSDPALIQTTAADGLVSSSSMAMFKLTDRRFWVRTKTSRSLVLPRVKWAIHEKEKFEGLINHLKDFIDGLNEIVPVNKETQDQIFQDDISSIIDISKLRLVEAACEGSYRTWSEKASQVIHDSEAGTLDRRTVEEYVRDQDEASESRSESNKKKVGEAFPDSYAPDLNQKHPVSVYRTPQVYTSSSPKSVKATWKIKMPSVQTGVGGRIANSIDLQKVNPSFDPSSLWPLLKRNEQLDGLQSIDYVNMALPIGKLYIHCAPCKCQIATAMNVALYARSVAVWTYVRVDYRLTTSCSSNRDLERMTLLQDDIKRTTMSNTDHGHHIDIVWLDQKTMELEDEIAPRVQYQPLIEEILSDYTSSTARRRPDKKCCGVVILGELDHIQPLMQGPRFPRTARMPRETEIWEMNYADRKSWCRLPLGSFTPSNFK